MMLDFATTMRLGADQYRDALAAAGWSAQFTQIGGMNAAIAVALEGGHVVLITDEDDALPWSRGDLEGWGVGFYGTEELGEGHLAFDSTTTLELDSLLELVEELTRRGALILARRQR